MANHCVAVFVDRCFDAAGVPRPYSFGTTDSGQSLRYRFSAVPSASPRALRAATRELRDYLRAVDCRVGGLRRVA